MSTARMLLDPKSIKAASGSPASTGPPIPGRSRKPPENQPQDNSMAAPGGHPSQNPRLSDVFNAKTLLNPRRQDRSPKTTKMEAVPNGDSHGTSSTRTLVEGLYNVESRANNPHKRVKIDPEQSATKKTAKNTSHHHSNGIVGEFMRPDPDKAADASKNSLVDLTNEESDDDLKIVSERSLDDKEVCYGLIASTVNAYLVPKPRSLSQFASDREWPVMKCDFVRKPAKDTVIEVTDPSGTPFARVNPDLSMALAPALDALTKFRVQARLINRRKKADEWPHQPCSEQLKIMINLYGRRGDVDKVGRHFGQNNFWLKPPMVSEAGIPVLNPHAQKKPLFQQKGQDKFARPITDLRTLEEATEAVSKVFDSFANASRTLGETDPPAEIIKTSLLTHQQQGLTFLLRQEQPRSYGSEESENSSLWRRKPKKNGAVIFNEVITGLSVRDEPEQIFGGLLADVMGLGKTLEALSLVASTLEDAKKFGDEKVMRDAPEDMLHLTLANAKATLIVCPTSTVKNWEDQIAAHVAPGALEYTVFHGPNREKNLFKLLSYDIVITTYGIIGSEFSNKKEGVVSPLRQLKWFRIILDEAHTIREQKALQSQACYNLEAQRRWCLTGTPIQNRLDDLGSLTRFLRLYPYDTAARFNQYIRGPAQAGDPAFLKALRVFVDSFTLRRLRDRVDLPPRKDYVAKLQFSEEENRLHEYFKQMAHVRIEHLAHSKEKRSGVQHHVLRGIMTLRLISAHGRELLNEKDLKLLKGMDAADAIDLDEEALPATITRNFARNVLSLKMEAELDTCVKCVRSISKEVVKDAEDDEPVLRCFVLPCLDLICTDCFGEYKPGFDSTPNEAVTCPFCSGEIAAQYVGFSGSTAQEILLAPDDTIDQGEDDEDQNVKTYGGPHTKTRALLADIQEMYEESEPLEAAGEAPLKCVVFSEFTSHLNLIERALSDNGYTFVRIDGSMSLNTRKKSMDALASDHSIRILLASIKAAGQGLNLTAASRAFIMEPMWNPAAEAQAVDRIYRIGQKRPVLVKRYQMENSIEGKIVELQRKKQQLADVSVNQNYKQLSKQEVREQHMKEILALFK